MRNVDDSIATKADAFLGQLAIKEGWATDVQVAAALSEHQRRQAAGDSGEFSELLVQRGILTRQQADILAERQRRRELNCARCGATFTVIGLPHGKTLPCKHCGHPLADRDAATMVLDANMPSLPMIDTSEEIAPTLLAATQATPAPGVSSQAPTFDGQRAANKATGPVQRQRQHELIGTLLAGKYQIQRLLGQGGMGAVYLAQQVNLNRLCAIKVLPRELAYSQTLVDRFQREAHACAQLNHANVVRVYDVDHDPTHGVNFLAMEYVEGESLDTVTKRHTRIPWKQAVEFTIQAARGLAAAHEKGIVHRDIKPANLMLRKDRAVQVMDFGLARVEQADNHLSQTGQLLGTPHYMSPEQARGETCDARTDVYSLGASLFYMVTGRTPFEAPVPTMLLLKVIDEQPEPASDLNPKVPTVVSAIIMRTMAKQREDRYPSMEALITDLEAVLAGREVSIRLPSQRLAPVQSATIQIGIREIVAGAIVLVVGFVLLLVFRQGSRQTTSAQLIEQAGELLALSERTSEPHEQRLAACQAFLNEHPELDADARARLRDAIVRLTAEQDRERERVRGQKAYEQALQQAANERLDMKVRLDACAAFFREHPNYPEPVELAKIQEKITRDLERREGQKQLDEFEPRLLATLHDGRIEDARKQYDAFVAAHRRTYPETLFPELEINRLRLQQQIDKAREPVAPLFDGSLIRRRFEEFLRRRDFNGARSLLDQVASKLPSTMLEQLRSELERASQSTSEPPLTHETSDFDAWLIAVVTEVLENQFDRALQHAQQFKLDWREHLSNQDEEALGGDEVEQAFLFLGVGLLDEGSAQQLEQLESLLEAAAFQAFAQARPYLQLLRALAFRTRNEVERAASIYRKLFGDGLYASCSVDTLIQVDLVPWLATAILIDGKSLAEKHPGERFAALAIEPGTPRVMAAQRSYRVMSPLVLNHPAIKPGRLPVERIPGHALPAFLVKEVRPARQLLDVPSAVARCKTWQRAERLDAEALVEVHALALASWMKTLEEHQQPNGPPVEIIKRPVSNSEWGRLIHSLDQLVAGHDFDEELYLPDSPEKHLLLVVLHLRWATSDPQRAQHLTNEANSILREYAREFGEDGDGSIQWMQKRLEGYIAQLRTLHQALGHQNSPRDPEDPNRDPQDPQRDPQDPNRDPQDPPRNPQDPNPRDTRHPPRDPQDPNPRDPRHPPRDPQDPQNPPRKPNDPQEPWPPHERPR
jgi:predicted Ser/Thr protein kinase